MTVVAAISNNGILTLGHSNGSELGGTPVVGGFSPWIQFADWALGITGESSVQRLLEFELRNGDLDLSSPEHVISSILRILNENQVGSKSDDDYVTTYGIYSILVNVREKCVWDVSGCLSLTRIPDGKIWAQGSGADYVIGANHALVRVGTSLSDAEMMELCIDAAVTNDVHCIGAPVVTTF